MIIQFSHANGFGAATYTHFFKQLAPHQVSAMPLIAHGQDYQKIDWRILADELIEYIEKHQTEKVIGVGHSLGGVMTHFAAQKRPDLFKKIILLDPPIPRFSKRMMIGIIKLLGMTDRFAPSGKSKKRRIHFPDRREAYRYFKTKALFKNFDEQCFQDYIDYGLKPTENGEGLELAFSSKIETEIFRTLPLYIGRDVAPLRLQHQDLPQSQPKRFYIYSNHHHVTSKKDIKWLKNHFKYTKFIPFDGGHLFPLEQPRETAKLIKQLIES